VPFSLKDQFDLRGKHTTIGFTEWMNRDVAAQDCGIAQIAQHYGAIPICKTNVPQTMLSFECNNPLWGRTLNPYNLKHTSGGSSGGEAALLACNGAAFGFGSDIGGSLRIPTSFTGIYALKPSAGRTFPFAGSCDVGEGALTLDVTAAPMTRNTADLQMLTTLFYNTMCPPSDGITTARDIQKRFGLENKVEASPLRPAWFDPVQAVSARSPLRQKLRVGYYYCDGMNKTSPACVRAVEMAKTALQGVKTKGEMPVIEMVEVDPKLLGTAQALEIFLGE
jgi:Asp-tRNA(Asn)/Glu-tRNA(Gln) amidotransferase A subunit family amidase